MQKRSPRLRSPSCLAVFALLASVLLVAASPRPVPPSSRPLLPGSTEVRGSKGFAASQPSSQPTSLPALPPEIPVPPRRINDLSAILLTYSGGVKSYFEPCGCQSDMLGGFPRLSLLLETYRKVGLSPLSIDAGSLFFEFTEVKPSQVAQAKVKAEMVADAFRRMGMRLGGVGPYDLSLGLSFHRELIAKSGMTAISSDLFEEKTGRPLYPTEAILLHGGIKFGFLSLTGEPPLKTEDNKPFAKTFWKDRSIRLLPPMEAAKKAVAALQAQGAQIILLLSTLGTAKTEALLRDLPSIDLAIEGEEGKGLDAPQEVGKSLLFSTEKEGQKTGILALYLRDLSWPWGAVQTQQQIQTQIAQIHEEIKKNLAQAAQMRKQGEDFAPIAAVYEEQAKKLQDVTLRELRASLSFVPRLTPQTKGFLHVLLPLSKQIPDFPPMVERILRYQEDAKTANFEAMKSIKPIPTTPEGNFYAGSEQCKLCHLPAYTFWKKTDHARAYQTLVKRGKQFDFDCIGCHVVGWQEPGGMYDIRDPKKFGNVQCENCHSYGGLHTRNAKKQAIQTLVPDTTCKGCHQGSHHPDFNYLRSLAKILGPGHGEARLKELLKK